ncbi:MAG: hypothetical protein JNL05_02765 [Flavobacteriales bacterium]|nr:hypothetical protein [Flavobacteriales bacterium]
MRHPITVALFALVVSCGQGNGNPVQEGAGHQADTARVMPWDDAAVFARLKRRLPPVSLPFRCALSGPEPRYMTLAPREQRLLNGTNEEQGVAIGLLPDTTVAFHVLWLGAADSWLPMITTFSKQDRRLSIEGLVIGQCGGPEPCYTCSETVTIGNDLSVLTTDTVRDCACDTNYAEIPGTCSRHVLKRTGSIGPTGARMSPVGKEPLPLEETLQALSP